MDLATMRNNVRRDLHDEDAGSYRWTDDELNRHIAGALAEFSRAAPLEDTAELATTAGSRELDISSLSDRVLIEAVEYPVGFFPPAYSRYSIWKDTLTILSDTVPDGGDARVYYARLHILNVSSSTIPSQFEDLIALGASAHALIEFAAHSINRVNIGGGNTPRTYREEGDSRLKTFLSELRRIARQSRVRIHQLYTPFTTPVSESTVTGP